MRTALRTPQYQSPPRHFGPQRRPLAAPLMDLSFVCPVRSIYACKYAPRHMRSSLHYKADHFAVCNTAPTLICTSLACIKYGPATQQVYSSNGSGVMYMHRISRSGSPVPYRVSCMDNNNIVTRAVTDAQLTDKERSSTSRSAMHLLRITKTLNSYDVQVSATSPAISRSRACNFISTFLAPLLLPTNSGSFAISDNRVTIWT